MQDGAATISNALQQCVSSRTVVWHGWRCAGAMQQQTEHLNMLHIGMQYAGWVGSGGSVLIVMMSCTTLTCATTVVLLLFD